MINSDEIHATRVIQEIAEEPIGEIPLVTIIVAMEESKGQHLTTTIGPASNATTPILRSVKFAIVVRPPVLVGREALVITEGVQNAVHNEIADDLTVEITIAVKRFTTITIGHVVNATTPILRSVKFATAVRLHAPVVQEAVLVVAGT